jgi:hypothetical protein
VRLLRPETVAQMGKNHLLAPAGERREEEPRPGRDRAEAPALREAPEPPLDEGCI